MYWIHCVASNNIQYVLGPLFSFPRTVMLLEYFCVEAREASAKTMSVVVLAQPVKHKIWDTKWDSLFFCNIW